MVKEVSPNPADVGGYAKASRVAQPIETVVSYLYDHTNVGRTAAMSICDRVATMSYSSPPVVQAPAGEPLRKSEHRQWSENPSLGVVYDVREVLEEPRAGVPEFWRLMTEREFWQGRWYFFASYAVAKLSGDVWPSHLGSAAAPCGPVDRDDVGQEAAMSLQRVLSKKVDLHAWFQRAKDPVGFMCGVIKLLCLKAAVRLQRKERQQAGPDGWSRIGPEGVAEAVPPPDVDLANEELFHLFFAELPETTAEVLWLRAEGRTWEETAAATGSTVKKVRTDRDKAVHQATRIFGDR